MTQPRSVTFHAIYTDLLRHLLKNGIREVNKRTGVSVLVNQGPVAMSFDVGSRMLPVPGVRRVFPKQAAVETAWFLSGSQSVHFLQRRGCKFWDKFVAADGETVESAYGYRWRKHFGRDQIADAITTLRNDPSNRQVLISAWDPSKDGLGQPSLNVPCPFSFQLTIVGNFIHFTSYIRSSDVFVGLPYDVMGHAFMMNAFACSLERAGLKGLRLGLMTLVLTHAHLYEPHWDYAREAIKHMDPKSFEMPLMSIETITEEPDTFIHAVDINGAVGPKDFNPKVDAIA